MPDSDTPTSSAGDGLTSPESQLLPQVDVLDETFIVAPPAVVADVVRDPAWCRRQWPDLCFEVFMDRGNQGVRWNVTGALTGSAEVWVEAFGEGSLVHWYLRASASPGHASPGPASPGPASPGPRQEARRRKLAARQVFWDLKDELETDRRSFPPRAVVERTLVGQLQP